MDINNWLDLLVELDRAEKNWYGIDITGMTPNQVTAMLENQSFSRYVWNNMDMYEHRLDSPIQDWQQCKMIYFERKEDITLFSLLK
jgi:hypothetical protein